MASYTLATEVPSRKLGARGVIALACLVLSSIPAGALYTFGNFAPYLVSYARNRTELTSLRNVDSVWVSAAMGLTESIGVSLGGVINRHLGPRLSIALGGFLYSAATIACYFVVNVSFIAFVVVFGLVQPVGGKIVYGVTLQTAMKWLPNHCSLASGLVLSGYGAAALIFNPVITAFINPDNLSPDLVTQDGERYFTDADLLDRVRYCFLVLGFSYLAIHIIGVIGVTQPRTQEDNVERIVLDEPRIEARFSTTHANKVVDIAWKSVDLPTNTAVIDNHCDDNCATEEVAPSEEMNRDNGPLHNIEITDDDPAQRHGSLALAPRASVKAVIHGALRTRSFYVVWFSVFWLTWAMRFLTSQYKAYGQTFIHDDLFLAIAGTLASVFNSICRPCWGMVMDKFGYKVSIRCISLVFTVLVATFVLTENFHKAAFMAWICVTYGVYCGQWAVSPSTFAKLFTVENMAINYGFIFLATAFSGITNLVVATTLKDIIGYHGMFFLSAGLGIIPFFLMFLFNGVDQNGVNI